MVLDEDDKSNFAQSKLDPTAREADITSAEHTKSISNFQPGLYSNKIILAPMVRTGELPFRLLALEYGADMVYSPEVIDKALIGCNRHFDDKTGIVEYRKPLNAVKKGHMAPKTALKVHTVLEKGKLILQLGSSCPELALQAAKTVHPDDIAGIDLNCGCPKKFSVHNGAGSALLRNPDKLCSIVKKLLVYGKPVSVKIRILRDREKTFELVGKLAQSGISALAVHCRTPSERPSNPGDWCVFKSIKKILLPYGIPLIANGDAFSLEDCRKLMQKEGDYGVDSVMMARAAQANVSIFRGEVLSRKSVAKAYLSKVIMTKTRWENAKYVLGAMFPSSISARIADGIRVAKSIEDLMDAFNYRVGDLVDLETYKSLFGSQDKEAFNEHCPYIPNVEITSR